MKIYLLQDVPNLGKQGEIKNVADGYAVNYLFPKKLAAVANAAIEKKAQQEQGKKATDAEKSKIEAAELSQRLKKITLEIPLKFSQKGKEAYSSANSQTIVQELAKQDIVLSKNQVELKKPLKEEGLYDVPLNLHPEVKATVKVRITALVSE